MPAYLKDWLLVLKLGWKPDSYTFAWQVERLSLQFFKDIEELLEETDKLCREIIFVLVCILLYVNNVVQEIDHTDCYIWCPFRKPSSYGLLDEQYTW